MNIQNAYAAYGAGIRDAGPAGTSGLEEALGRIGKRNDVKTERSGKSLFDTAETAFSAAEETSESAMISDIYVKNLGDSEKTGQQESDNRTEAEKNSDRLEDTANRITSDDMEELINEGFDVFGMTTEELEAAVDRLKLQKELYSKAVEGQIEDKIENREAAIAKALHALDGSPEAERIADKLMKANLPVTDANVRKIAIALEMAGNRTGVSSSEAEYLIRNKLSPTLENISSARAASQSSGRKEKNLSEEAWNQLRPTVSHLLFQAGLRQGRDIMEAAQDFIRKDIPLTAENLSAYASITKIRLSDDEILTRAVDALSVGQDPKSANLLSPGAKQIRQILKNNENVTDEAIDYAVAKKAAQTGTYDPDRLDLSLSELHEAQEDVNEKAVVPMLLEEYSNAGVGQAASIKARRQLEEVKAKMTYEAGYRLAKEGIRIDSVSMNRLINDLKALENRFYSDFFRQSGAAPGSYTQDDVDLLKDTTKKLKEIEAMPASIIYDTADRADTITLNEIHAEGSSRAFDRFNQTFETVMTSPGAKYGDSIEKAFANVDSLLKDAGLPVTEETRRATRILGYASAEVTPENVQKISEYNEKLRDAIANLHPAVTVRMIRDGINPLRMNLDDLNRKIGELKETEGITKEDTYSNFLVNLEKKEGLTNEERDAYVAIYRALHTISEDRDPALGQVFRQGAEPTLQALLTAIRSGKVSGSETVVNDTFTNLAKVSRDVDRIENKILAGLGKPDSEDGLLLNRIAEETDKEIEEMTVDAHRTAEEWVKSLQDISSDGKNATAFLEDFNILTNLENIDAAKDLLKDDTKVFKDWKRFKTMATGEEGILPDFLESLNSEDEMQEAYKAFADKTKEIKQEILRDPAMSRLDIKALKKTDVAARFMNRLGKRQFYRIPVDTGNDIVSMNVTILDDPDGNSSKVWASVPTENLGTVSAEASIADNRMKCFIRSTRGDGLSALKERQLNLFAELAQNGIGIGSIYYGAEEVSKDKYEYMTDGAYKNVPEPETDATGKTNSELYRIAKVFVTHVRQADSEFRQ